MSMFDKAKDAASEHGDKLEGVSDQGLDKAGQFAQDKGVGAEHVDQGKQFLDDKIGEPGQGGDNADQAQ